MSPPRTTHAVRRCGLSRSHRIAIVTEKSTDASACTASLKTPSAGESLGPGYSKHNPRLQDGDGNFTDDDHAEDDVFKLARLKEEKVKIDTSIDALKTQIEDRLHARRQEEIQEQISHYKTLQRDITTLKRVLEGYERGNPQWLERKREEIDRQKIQAAQWTNNVEILMDWMEQASGGDKQRLQQYCYGTEYLDGEGLRAL
ncbi:MAG: hypothetical protein Q9174_005158 [Haloplaca sp. 1 TL-2023]